jgi:polyketide synthase PksN
MNNHADLVLVIRQAVANALQLPLHEINTDEDFGRSGMDSIQAMYALDEIERKLNIELNPILFWEYATINRLAAYLQNQFQSSSPD